MVPVFCKHPFEGLLDRKDLQFMTATFVPLPNMNGFYSVGTTASFSCSGQQEYLLKGPTSAVCLSSGKWTALPSCLGNLFTHFPVTHFWVQKQTYWLPLDAYHYPKFKQSKGILVTVSCGPLDHPANGSVDPSGVKIPVGYSAKFRCDQGRSDNLELDTHYDTITCDVHGEWGGRKIPVCGGASVFPGALLGCFLLSCCSCVIV